MVRVQLNDDAAAAPGLTGRRRTAIVVILGALSAFGPLSMVAPVLAPLAGGQIVQVTDWRGLAGVLQFTTGAIVPPLVSGAVGATAVSMTATMLVSFTAALAALAAVASRRATAEPESAGLVLDREFKSSRTSRWPS